jgi:hypothetical protein|tara:strand:- start:88 stop:393 length:306 start_codon:yes stop_codon:yes gene_type:complete
MTNFPVYDHFLYEVGQFVLSSFVALPGGEKDRAEGLIRDCYQIVERSYQECPGGIQLHYLCRPHGFMRDKNTMIRLNEIELIEMPEPADAADAPYGETAAG